MHNTTKNFEEAFWDFVSKRVTEDLDHLLQSDREYSRLTLEIEAQEERVKACVHSADIREFDSLFDRLNSLCGEMESTVSDIMYLQGIRDGFRLYNILMDEKKEA